MVVIFKVQEVEEVEEVKEVTEVKEVKDGMKENKVEKANTKFETCAFMMKTPQVCITILHPPIGQ